MRKFRPFFIFFLALIFTDVKSQCVGPDFFVPGNNCLGKKIVFSPDDLTLSDYQWDFCPEDLSNTPSASVLLNSNAASSPFKVDLVEYNGNYFGFFTSRNSKKIFRLDFGSDVNNMPTVVDLGGVGVSSDGWLSIEIVLEDEVFYGFIIDFNNKVYRVSFGTSLDSQPSDAETIYSDGLLSHPIDLAVLEEGGSKFLFVANFSSNKITRIKLDQSFSDPPSALLVDEITVTGSGGLAGMSFLKQCDLWYAVTTSLSTTIAKLTFNNGLDDLSPTVDLLTGFGFSPAAPAGVALVQENDKYYAFIQSNSTSDLYRIEFGNLISNSAPTATNLGDLNVLSGIWGFAMHKVKSDWLVLSSENTGTRIFKINFPNNCFSDTKFSTAVNPEVTITQAGAFKISLSAKISQGHTSSKTSSIVTSSLTAPDIDFTSQSICVNNDVVFHPVNESQDIASYQWDFGDLSSFSFSSNPTHQFVLAGNYEVSLSVIALNGCDNKKSKTLKIYQIPQSNFLVPSAPLICTNNEFTFTNTTTDNFDGNLTYQWYVDNNPAATTDNLKYTFTSIGNKDIKLKASIPGCSNESTQTINNVQSGPIVDFTITGKCAGDPVTFTNNSSGSIAGYLWDLGGSSDTNINPTKTFLTPAIYDISLETIGTNGCVSTLSKNLTIYSKPQPDFSLSLPPFSCTGTPSQFTNATPNPTDSNISNWLWSFGDPANGSSTSKEPAYTYLNAGGYNVSLLATTNFGCSASVQKPITISSSPVASFTNGAACLNQGTKFTDASGSNIKAWLWTMGSSTYSFNNPTHVFGTTGTQTVSLVVTGNNDCISMISKTVNVPIPVSISFSIQNLCEDQPTSFQDTTPAGNDPVASWSWDIGGLSTKTGSSTSYTFPQSGTYSIKLNSTRQSGCTYSQTKSAIITPTPTAKFSTMPEWGTPPLSIQFVNESTGASTYQWKFNDKNNSVSTSPSPTFVFNDLGEFVVDMTATSEQGCSNTFSNKVSVVIPSVDVDLKELKLIKDEVSGSYQMMVTIKNLSNFPLDKIGVLIYISGNATIKETINTRIIPNGEITQLLTNEILPGTSTTYLCAELSIKDDKDLINNKRCEPLVAEAVVFPPYPNPNQGLFQFDWIAGEKEEAQFEVLNSMGQSILQQTVTATNVGLNQIQIDLRSLPDGKFYFKFSSSAISKTLPILIIR